MTGPTCSRNGATGTAAADGILLPGPSLDGQVPAPPTVTALVVAEAVRTAAGLSLPDGARLLIELALADGPWTAGALSGWGGDVGRPRTRASTGPLADLCEHLQWEHVQGPTYDVLGTGSQTEILAATTDDTRWSKWAPAARNLGAHAVLAIRLHVDRPVGALTFYASDREAADHAGLAPVRTIAAYLSTLVRAADTERHLERALATRTKIGQAVGILMHRYAISSDQAFGLLRRTSQQQNIKIVSLAVDLVDYGVFPARAAG